MHALGCDGEHTPGVHMMMGENNAGVNLLAGGEVEEEAGEEDETEGEWEYEDGGWWVGTVGVVESLEETEGIPCTVTDLEPFQGNVQGAEEDDSQVEWVHNFQANEYSEGELAGDEEWDLGSGHPHLGEEEASAPRAEPRQPPLNGQTRPLRPAGNGQQELKKKPRMTTDQHWEEVRRDAWLRQALSSDTSDTEEDEEWQGRFAESGR